METTIPCVCPDAPHETDSITFRDKMDMVTALSIRKEVGIEKIDNPDMMGGATLALIDSLYMLYGIESWSLVDENGKPIAPTHKAIRQLMDDHPIEAMQAAEVSEPLYNPVVLLPLLQEASKSSRPSRTPASMSQSQGSSGRVSTRRKRTQSKPSLTSTTPTDGTGSITSQLDGDSRLSLRSA